MKSVKIMSVREAKDFLNVSNQTIYNMIGDGRLTSYRKGSAGKGSRHGITLGSVIDNLKK